MALRIKEICKIKGISMTEIAQRIGISPITLSQSLNGNPTLSRLTEVAGILGVEVSELFEAPKTRAIYGCLYVNGEPTIVNNIEDILTVLKRIEA